MDECFYEFINDIKYINCFNLYEKQIRSNRNQRKKKQKQHKQKDNNLFRHLLLRLFTCQVFDVNAIRRQKKCVQLLSDF